MMEWMLMPYRRYAEFSGRSRRKEYWMFTLFTVIVYALIAAFMFAGGLGTALSGVEDPQFGVSFWIGAVLMVFFLGTLVPGIAVIVRRLHDRDMSGWWYLGFIVLGMIPFVGWIASIAFLVILCLPGTAGLNRFGDDPKNPAGYDVFG
ncbi:DUF805 domain-containing protein [Novosphingobium subterraneum]